MNVDGERETQAPGESAAPFQGASSDEASPLAEVYFTPGGVPIFEADLAPLVQGLLTQAAIDRLIAHPAYADSARRTLAGWAPRPGDDLKKSRALQDIGLFVAGLWAIQLHAGPWGLTHTSLTAVISAWGLTSRGRVSPMLAYLRFRGMIQLAPSSDGRVTRYAPTQALRDQFDFWFRRELEGCAALFPEAAEALARMDEQGMLGRLVAAYSLMMQGSQQTPPARPPTLDVFSHRRAGLIILGQILLAADAGGSFPPAGPVRLVLNDLARKSAASRGQVQAVLREGAKAGFLIRDEDGLTTFSDDLQRHVRDFLPIYWLALGWAARRALGQAEPS